MPEEHPRLTIILANDGESLCWLCGACWSNVQVDPEIGHRTNIPEKWKKYTSSAATAEPNSSFQWPS
jgi:hypothetical protein